MRKKLALIMTVCMLFMLTACGKTEAVISVEDAIKQIGEVTYSSEALITAAEEKYNNLTDEEKKDVENAADLTAAKEAYHDLVIAPIDQLREQISTINTAANEFDFFTCAELIKTIRNDLESMPSELYDMSVQVTVDDYDQEVPDQLSTFEEFIDLCCVNNTYFAQPLYVVSVAPEFTNLVNDHGDFAAYNWWTTSWENAEEALNEYKEYVSKSTEIIDESTTSFSFQDNSGNMVEVRINHSTSEYCTLQVRVPRF